MRALALVHEPDGYSGQVGVRLRERGIDLDEHLITADYDRPNDAAPFPDLASYDLVLPMGSVRSLTRKDEISNWIHVELDLMRDAHERDQPMLGVCFGGQLLAEALGGHVEESPVTEIGWSLIEPPPGVVNPVGPGPWKEWHHDRFFAPPGAELLAVNAIGQQLFRLGRTVGTQFHPEVDADHVAEWLGQADDPYLHSHGIDRDQILAEAREHEAHNIVQCHALVDWFLDEVAFPTGA